MRSCEGDRGLSSDTPPPPKAQPPAPSGPAPIEALRDQLGLKLEPSKASLPVLFIDKVERPSEN
jgi:uncharacterized protein (TIGR03435 family)